MQSIFYAFARRPRYFWHLLMDLY